MLTLLALATALAAPGDPPVKAGVGPFLNLGGTFMNQPRSLTADGVNVLYNGFAGFSPGGGLAVDVRAVGVVGFELDFIYSADNALSQYDINGQTLRFGIKQGAFHLPVIFKLSIPKGPVRPSLQGGFHFVFPGTPKVVDVPEEMPFEIVAHSEPYNLALVGFGFEFVPNVPNMDIRIPLNIRGSVNSGLGKTAGERANYGIDDDLMLTSIDYLTAWQYHAAVTLGVSFFFPPG